MAIMTDQSANPYGEEHRLACSRNLDKYLRQSHSKPSPAEFRFCKHTCRPPPWIVTLRMWKFLAAQVSPVCCLLDPLLVLWIKTRNHILHPSTSWTLPLIQLPVALWVCLAVIGKRCCTWFGVSLGHDSDNRGCAALQAPQRVMRRKRRKTVT